MANKPGMDKLKTDSKQSFDQAFKRFAQSSFAKQLVGGTASGWVTGVILTHVGKSAALAVGSGIIVWELAHYKGYVSSDWTSLKHQAQNKLNEAEAKGKAPQLLSQVKGMAGKNKTFTAGFLGGVLLGIAF